MVCRQRDILTLLEKNKDILEDLRLMEVTLLGSWSTVLMWIRDNCSLKFLKVDALLEFEENASGDLHHHDEKVWLDSGFDVQDGSGDLSHLDELLEQKRKEQASLEEED